MVLAEPFFPTNSTDVQLTPAQQQWLAEHPVIRVPATRESPYGPFVFFDNQGQPRGLTVDYLSLLEKRLGVHFKFVNTGTTTYALDALDSHNIDAVITVQNESWRKDDLLYTRPYVRVPIAIIMRSGHEGRASMKDLEHMPVAMRRDSAVDHWLQQAHPEIRRVRAPDSRKALLRLVFGAADAALVDLGEASYLMARGNIKNIHIVGMLKRTYALRFAVLDSQPMLRDILDAGLASISAEELTDLYDRWIMAEPPQIVLPWQARLVIGVVLVVIVVVIAAILLWNRSLKQLTQRRTRELVEELKQRKQVEQQLRYSEQRWQFALEGANSAVWDWSLTTQTITFSKRWQQLLGYGNTPTTIPMAEWERLVHPDDLGTARQIMKRIVTSRLDDHDWNEVRLRASNDEYRWILVRGMVVETDDDHAPLRVIGTQEDITLRKNAELEVEYLAMHDVLTGLPNRRMLRKYFDDAAAIAQRRHSHLGLVFLDIDHFKRINDTMGHTLGDDLIAAMAQRIRAHLDDQDTVSRQGGDEFIIILGHRDGHATLQHDLDNLLASLRQPYTLTDLVLNATVTAGVAIYPDHGRDFETLQRKADLAMYHAKEKGRDTWSFYNEAMITRLNDRMALRSDLKDALEHGEFELHYQPQYAFDQDHPIGVEALLRWPHPVHGMISPGRFIPVAEESGLIIPIGEWVLRQACRQAVAWQQTGMPKMTMAVNLSALQFARGDIADTVDRILAASGLPPELLELEITESMLIDNTRPVREALKHFKRRGIKVAIDDFGTGYSSLSYLKSLEVDKLKIDQSFVRGLESNDKSASIVRAIIQLAHSLNMQVIAEGVETASAQKWLQNAGCDEVQGFYRARPMPADGIRTIMPSTTVVPHNRAYAKSRFRRK